MGNIHNELRRSPLSGALTRALGAQLGTEGLERFGETLQPIMDLWGLPEWNYLRRDFLCGIHGQATAVPAEFAAVALVNANVSGKTLIVVERIAFALGAAGSATIRLADQTAVAATLTGISKGITRDTRTTRSTFFPGGHGTMFTGTDVGAIGVTMEQAFSPGTDVGLAVTSLPFVLGPGGALVVQAETANVAIAVSWGYRERSTYPGELD